MTAALAAALPIALGILIATLPLMAVPLTLVSGGAIGILCWFLTGYTGGFLTLGGAVILTADLISLAGDGPSRAMALLRVALGLLLLWFAFRKWQSRTAPGEPADIPAWVKTLDTLTPAKAAGLGFLLVTLNPKNAVLVISGALAIAAATPAPLAQLVALLAFTATAAAGLATPLVLWLALGPRVLAPLGKLRALLIRYNAQILATVLAVMGALVIKGAIPYL